MKYVELKKSLKEKIYNNYLLVGEDDYLLSKSCELIYNALNIKFDELNYFNFIGDTINCEDVVRTLNTLPAFDNYKLIILNIHIKTKILNTHLINEYLKTPNPSSIFIVVAGNNDIFKNEKSFELVDCNKLSEKYVDSFVKSILLKTNTQITTGALKTLNEYCAYSLTKINKELDKLISYVADKKIIEEKDVVLLVSKTLEFQIFELTENLAKKNSDKVFEILNLLKHKKDSFKGILHLIYNHFRRLFYVAISNFSKSQLSAMLGVKDYAITVAYRQSSLFSKRNLKIIINEIDNLDYQLKTGDISYDIAVDYLILTILSL